MVGKKNRLKHADVFSSITPIGLSLIHVGNMNNHKHVHHGREHIGKYINLKVKL